MIAETISSGCRVFSQNNRGLLDYDYFLNFYPNKHETNLRDGESVIPNITANGSMNRSQHEGKIQDKYLTERAA